MNFLREINNVSTFKPTQGILLELYNWLIKEDLEREAATNLFIEKGYTNFKVHFKRIKDQLLEGLLQNSFKELSTVQKQHIQLIKKYAQAKILIKLHKRIAGTQIAEEAIRKAEALDMIEIALSLSRDLAVQFAVQQNKSPKYHYYAAKSATLKKAYDEEYAIMKLNNQFLYALRNKEPLAGIFEALAAWEEKAKQNEHYQFRLFYHHCINRMAGYQKNNELFLSNTQSAIAFFENFKTPLPYTTKWLFQLNLVPLYLQQKDYYRTEKTLSACLKLPSEGSYNWHLTLMYKALYGFYTNKPAISLSALQKAHSVKKKCSSDIMDERWLMIHAYLIWFNKIGRVDYGKKFRLYKFFNTIPNNTKDKPQKANLLVLEFLHLLVDNKLKGYTKKTFSLDHLIPKYFNGHSFRRTKYFLNCLRSVVKGNFHPVGAARHAAPHLAKIHQFKEEVDLNLLDKEVVPYEILWSEVVAFLRKK